MGRPSKPESQKAVQLGWRGYSEDRRNLEFCSKKTRKSKSECIRIAIKALKEQIKCGKKA